MDARIVNIVNNYMILFIQQVLRINQQKQLNNINNIIGNSNINIRNDQITYEKITTKKDLDMSVNQLTFCHSAINYTHFIEPIFHCFSIDYICHVYSFRKISLDRVT